MAITESLGALGQWSLSLEEDTPRFLRDALEYFGHITIHTGRINPALVGDGLLRSSRYTGVLRGIGEDDDSVELSGVGMLFWLGDEDDKGAVIEDLITFDNETFTQTVRSLLPASGAVTEGLLTPIPGTFSGPFQFVSPRKAIDYVAAMMGGEYRVNGDATLDAGAIEDLYVTDPKCIITQRGAGVDMDLRALLGKAAIDVDVDDYTTRVVLLAASTESQVATGAVGLPPEEIPYKDLHGNPVALTRLVSESATDSTNAQARAQLQLNRFSGTRDALALSTPEYDINGSAQVGDYVWVYNPDIDLEDLTNEVPFRGLLLHPIKLRLIESTWPISPGFTVSYRNGAGEWFDLTDYVKWETGQTTVKVGGYNRSLTHTGSEPIGRLPQPDTSVPGVPLWVEPFRLGVYQSPTTGSARGDVILAWERPDNTNGTPIVDGSHYDIRYRRATTPLYPVSWDQLEDTEMSWDQLEASGATWDNPVQYDETEWQTATAPFDVETFRLQELVPSMGYEVQIRAVDQATPPNAGEWSTLAEFQTTNDNIPPATPAPPAIASNPLAVQMVHRLGIAEGGEFNLDRDLHHLELHGSSDPMFTPSSDTMLGKAMAGWGLITGQIPVVSTFQINVVNPQWFRVIAVDEAGNRSLPSDAIQAKAGLIDNQWISNLTVTKVTAGTVSADWLVGGRITTALTGARVEMTSEGLKGWDISGLMSLHWSTVDGSLNVTGRGGIKVRGGGNVEITDGAVVIKNAAGQVIVELGECADGRHGVQVYKDNGARVARIGELASAGGEGIEFVSDLGALVRASTLAFGTAAASVAAAGATASTTFTDLPGSVGPVTSATVGSSGRAIVIVGAWILANAIPRDGSASFAYLDANGVTSNASTIRSLSVSDGNSSASRAFLVTGLPAGNTTFAMKYNAQHGSVTFVDRHIIVIPF